MMDESNTFSDELRSLTERGLKRSLQDLDGRQGREVILSGRKVLNFCSNNYLGLADDPRLVRVAADALMREGLGSGASRLVCGNMNAHRRLEESLARFKKTERCLLFSSGYMANVGIISGLFGRDDLILSDKLNHASIIDGIILSRAEFKRYAHKDMTSLEEMLKNAARYCRRVIITDSVFSMDGDCAPLGEIAELASRYNALVMVDEAHALGVLGARGGGLVEHLALEGRVDIQMGTLSKAVGAFGAYCCGSRDMIELLINRARSFVYTTALPPSVVAAADEALRIIAEDTAGRRKLGRNADYLRAELKRIGFDTMSSQTPIIPVLIRDAQACVAFSRRLLEKGIFVQAIRPPTVPPNTSRLRVTVMATHTQDDMDQLIDACGHVGKEFGLIP